jgi:GWxTD domain-containing protein
LLVPRFLWDLSLKGLVMKKYSWFSILLIFIGSLANVPLVFSAIRIDVDHAVFRQDDTQSVAEIYYAIYVSDLKFLPTIDNNMHAQVVCKLTVKKDGKYWNDTSWKMEKNLPVNSVESDTSQMVDVLQYLLPSGNYEYELYIKDFNDTNQTATITNTMKVDLFPDNKIATSDIEFATSIKKAEPDKNNTFWKNGLEIIPNPSAIYGKKTPMLFYYLESYHLDKILNSGIYQTKTIITSAEGEIIKDIKPRIQKKKALAASVEVNTVHLSTLPSGTYKLNFEIYNDQDKLLIASSKKFYIYNPTVAVSTMPEMENLESAVLESEYTNMTEKELNNEFDLTQYFATKEQKDFYKKLDNVEGKRQFLYQFWKKVDPRPGTKENEFKLQYLKRVEDANKNYRTYSRKGWQTDRGRVYILNGPPTDIERNPNNPTSFAHEIWHYDNIEGGVIFVFIDLQEFGDYSQIHSTKRGETTNKNWESLISK